MNSASFNDGPYGTGRVGIGKVTTPKGKPKANPGKTQSKPKPSSKKK